MATPTPFTFQGFLRYPPDEGAPDADRDFSVASTFTSKSEARLDLVGAGTQTVSFGTLAALGAKGVLVEVEAVAPGGSAAPVNLQVNGGGATGQIEVDQGGFWALGSPGPLAGLLSMDIVHTQNACVKVYILG